jgi:hypothetical protein
MTVHDREPAPVEVKSSRDSRTRASLDRFVDEYDTSLGKPFVIHSKDIERTEDATYIPICMTCLL